MSSSLSPPALGSTNNNNNNNNNSNVNNNNNPCCPEAGVLSAGVGSSGGGGSGSGVGACESASAGGAPSGAGQPHQSVPAAQPLPSGGGDQFSLVWNTFPRNLSSGLYSLLAGEQLVDVTLAAEGQILRAHKLILSVCSTYFRDLFKENSCKHPIVILKDVNYRDLSAMLHFMYQGEVNIKQEDIASFLKVAEILKIKGLTRTADDDNEFERESVELSSPFHQYHQHTQQQHQHPQYHQHPHSQQQQQHHHQQSFATQLDSMHQVHHQYPNFGSPTSAGHQSPARCTPGLCEASLVSHHQHQQQKQHEGASDLYGQSPGLSSMMEHSGHRETPAVIDIEDDDDENDDEDDEGPLDCSASVADKSVKSEFEFREHKTGIGVLNPGSFVPDIEVIGPRGLQSQSDNHEAQDPQPPGSQALHYNPAHCQSEPLDLMESSAHSSKAPGEGLEESGGGSKGRRTVKGLPGSSLSLETTLRVISELGPTLKMERGKVIRMYSCPWCLRHFTRKENLKLHVRYIHGPLESLTCKLCGNKYKNSNSLRVHSYLYHNAQRNKGANKSSVEGNA